MIETEGPDPGYECTPCVKQTGLGGQAEPSPAGGPVMAGLLRYSITQWLWFRGWVDNRP